MTDKSLDHELHVAVLGRMREFTNDISEIAALDAAIASLAAHRGETECDGPCVENDGCPTELAVLQRYWRAHPPLFSYRHFKERAEAAEAKLALAELALYKIAARRILSTGTPSVPDLTAEAANNTAAEAIYAIAAGEGK